MAKTKIKTKIAFISGSRADFGLMTSVLKEINHSPHFQLLVYSTGMDLMPKYGKTIDQVRKVFPQVKAIPAIFKKDNRTGMAEFGATFLKAFISLLEKDKPDLVIILGDRVEMMCTAMACLYLGIPTAHFHGGEKTFSVDEPARHAITKMASLHFVATTQAGQRIKKMGEEAKRIHVVGAPSLDNIARLKFPSRELIFKKFKLDTHKPLIVLTQHSVTEEWKDAGSNMEQIMAAVKYFDAEVVVVYPNADSGSEKIIAVIEKEKNNPKFHIYKHIPYNEFLSLAKEASVWVGNSSAIMIESGSFGTPCVLVGTRQLGREDSGNVLKVGYDTKEIIQAIQKSLTDKKYLKKLKKVKNMWGDGKTSQKVMKILHTTKLDTTLLVKQLTY